MGSINNNHPMKAGVKKYWGAKYFEEDIILYARQEGDEIINKLGKIVDIDAGSAQNGRFCIVEDSSGHYYTVSEDSIVDAFPSKKRGEWLRNWNNLVQEVEELRNWNNLVQEAEDMKKLSATDMKYSEGDTITYEKQEKGKIIHKIGVIKEIIVKTAHLGNKINRYYIVEGYAVHEDCVIDGIHSENGIHSEKRKSCGSCE